jgi:hypothetical protein
MALDVVDDRGGADYWRDVGFDKECKHAVSTHR